MKSIGHTRITLVAMACAMSATFTPPFTAPAHAEECTTSAPAGTYTVAVCISAPDDGMEVRGDVPVTASVSVSSGGPGVSRMTFLLDGQDLLVDYEAPYEFVLPTGSFGDGARTLSLRATLRDGQLSASTEITLAFANGQTAPPPAPTGFAPRTGTTPASGAPFVVAATGDGASGQTSSDNVVDTIAAIQPNMVVYTGDVYDDGTYTEFKNWYGEAARYGRFYSITNPILGNHEQTSSGWDGYDRYWRSPPPFYSYDAGGWHFVVFNSDGRFKQFQPGTPQYDWLAADLAANDEDCVIAGFHHPVVSVGPQGDSTHLDAIWRLLAQHGVDIALTGHDHNYQRWQPLNGDLAADADGITQFVLGGGGHGIQSFQRTDSRLAMGVDTVPTAFGALELRLNAGGAAYAYRNTGGAVLDSGTVTCAKTSVDSTPPTAPSSLIAEVNGGRVDLAWAAATDNVGVESYVVRRNGSAIATVSGHELSFSDAAIQPNTTYTYEVLARDAAGNTSPPSNQASVTTASGPTSLTIEPSADTYVNEAAPTKNYGGATVLRVDGSPVMRSYLKFDLSGVPSNVVSAKLRVFANTNHSLGYEVRSTGTGWDERTLSYADAPTPGGLIAQSGRLTADSYSELDVTAALSGSGSLGLALDAVNNTALSASSRESSTPPQLIIQAGTDTGNHRPSADDVTITTPANTAATWAPVVSDPDQDVLTCTITTPPAKGQATVAADCSSGTYSPGVDAGGTDTFVYSVSDGSETDTGQVSVSITAVNEAPVVEAATLTLTEGMTKTVELRASDSDGQCPVVFDVVSAPMHGTLGTLDPVQCSGGSAQTTVAYTAETGYSGSDSFSVTATDAAGLTSAPRAVSITVQSRQTQLLLNPTADAFVNAGSPNANFGSNAQLRVDTQPEIRSYLKFEVPEDVGPVVSATLRVYAGSRHPAGYGLSRSGTAWTEGGITYATAPAVGEALGSSGPTVSGGYTEVDVTAYVTGAGSFGFALLPLNATNLKLWSKESSDPPVLVLRTS